MLDQVECHSDFEYAERPIAFIWERQRLVIGKILNASRTPDGKQFRVSAMDGSMFDLFYNETNDDWRIEPI